MKDNAVSPAVGTILLVAMTVVFVAIVAIVAVGLSGGLFDSKDVGLILDTYSMGGSTPEHGVTVTVMGGKDAGDITELRVTIDGPDLYYQTRGNSYVPSPVTGAGYRYFADTGTYMKLYDTTWVMTNELNNTGVLENRLATVTGKFRDGTEQVLLMKRVTIPAMTGVAQQFNYTYVRVLSFTNTTGVPGHGLLVTPINDSVTKVDSVTLSKLKDSTGKDVPMGPLTSPHQYDNEYFFYLETGMDVLDSPYPTSSNADRLTGMASVSVSLSDGSTKTDTIPVDIPARVNFFENSSIVSGTFDSAISKGTGYVVPLTINKGSIRNVNQMYYCITSGNDHYKPHSWDISTLENGYSLGSSEPNGINLTAYSNGTLEVFVRSKLGNTAVWYRVASASVSSLLP
ncbi:type IV pilin [Methanocorpusculum sp. MG]|uniref:Type IV pilin n=1 Tax=Methanocorpusculum petauri TaxID=3002863 RepID=A0ABT4II72_9EURY|nr:type IV pilin [Methanocorpusculum petauri]MCZ0861434.1 type IV pilin [Methanocorpusculum petauri]MDE2444119.1 type IV pilin [Methanocorpusculum sp.]